MVKRKKRVSGATAMIARGKKQVVIWLAEAELEELKAAAKRAKLPVATYVRRTALAWARLGAAEELCERLRGSGAPANFPLEEPSRQRR